MAAVSASSSGKPPLTLTFETATERLAAFAGGARPAGFVNVIVPEGRVAGARVVGVTVDGETICPRETCAVVTAARKQANRSHVVR